MPVNEFEKQVQQKMDELQLRPSGQVWEEVEKRIRKEKKRRIVFLWFLLLMLLVGGGASWFIINAGKSDYTSVAKKQTVPVGPATDKKENTVPLINKTEQPPAVDITMGKENTPATSTVVSSAPDPVTRGKETITLPIIKKVVSNSNNLFIATNNNNKEKKDNRKTSITNGETVSIDITAGEKKKNNNENNPVQINTAPAVPGKTSDPAAKAVEPILNEPAASNEIKTPASTDSVIVTTTDMVTLTADSSSKMEASKTNLSTKKKSKWQWGVIILPGISHTAQGKLFSGLFGGQKSADGLFSSPSAGTGGSLVPFAPPVLIESPQPGFSFDIGLIAQRPVSKKLDFGAGIHYSYISTKVKVGNRVAAVRQVNNSFSSSVTVSSYYRANAIDPNNGGQVYTNQYNLVGLSASLSWKLIRKKNFSMNWDNSFMGSRIISTNALLYDGGLRGYYKDFNAFRKTQLSIVTGLSIPVLKKDKFTLSLDPFTSYGLSPVLKHSNSNMNSHFVNYGIGVKLLFK